MPPTKRAKLPAWGGSLKPLQQMASDFHGMDEQTIKVAASKAARVIQTSCQDIIFTERDLDDYTDVAEATTTWVDDNNVWVGIQDGALKAKADDMNERVFPVIETAFDMSKAEAVETFETELRFS